MWTIGIIFLTIIFSLIGSFRSDDEYFRDRFLFVGAFCVIFILILMMWADNRPIMDGEHIKIEDYRIVKIEGRYKYVINGKAYPLTQIKEIPSDEKKGLYEVICNDNIYPQCYNNFILYK